MRIELLGQHHDRSRFNCGEPALDDYLKKFARQNDDKGLGRTFVIVDPPGLAVAGYYTVSMSAVKFDTIPLKLPRYPIPVVLLGRLAVDESFRGKRLGEQLLLDALARADRVSADVGVLAVEVRALHDRAKNFYLKYGFTPLLDDPLHLYLPMKTIRKLNLNP